VWDGRHGPPSDRSCGYNARAIEGVYRHPVQPEKVKKRVQADEKDPVIICSFGRT